MKTKKQREWQHFRQMVARVFLILLFVFLAGCGRCEEEFLQSVGQSAVEKETQITEQNANDAEEQKPEQNANEPGEQKPEQDANDAEEQKSEQDANEPETIYVDVCGAVMEPGVYELETGNRVFQAIDAAGGFAPDAAGEYINQAEALCDGQQIYIPTREEAEQEDSWKSPLEKNTAWASGGEYAQNGEDGTVGEADAGSNGEAARGKINLNTAEEEDLTTLTGIGSSKAQAILAYREEHGGFSAIEEILNVPGIKEGTFMKIKDQIVVE